MNSNNVVNEFFFTEDRDYIIKKRIKSISIIGTEYDYESNKDIECIRFKFFYQNGLLYRKEEYSCGDLQSVTIYNENGKESSYFKFYRFSGFIHPRIIEFKEYFYENSLLKAEKTFERSKLNMFEDVLKEKSQYSYNEHGRVLSEENEYFSNNESHKSNIKYEFPSENVMIRYYQGDLQSVTFTENNAENKITELISVPASIYNLPDFDYRTTEDYLEKIIFQYKDGCLIEIKGKTYSQNCSYSLDNEGLYSEISIFQEPFKVIYERIGALASLFLRDSKSVIRIDKISVNDILSQLKLYYNIDNITWDNIVSSPNLMSMYREILLSFHLKDNIDVYKYIFNEEALVTEGKTIIDNSQKSKSLKYFSDINNRSPSLPDWFAATYPDVIMWIIDNEQFNNDSKLESLDFGGFMQKNAPFITLRYLIESYLNKTKKKLEFSN